MAERTRELTKFVRARIRAGEFGRSPAQAGDEPDEKLQEAPTPLRRRGTSPQGGPQRNRAPPPRGKYVAPPVRQRARGGLSMTQVNAIHREHRARIERRARGTAVSPAYRHLGSTISKSFGGPYSSKPRLSVNNTGPGNFIIRARQGMSHGVRQQILNLLARAPKVLWVNGHKHNKKAAYTLIVDLLRKHESVEIMLN